MAARREYTWTRMLVPFRPKQRTPAPIFFLLNMHISLILPSVHEQHPTVINKEPNVAAHMLSICKIVALFYHHARFSDNQQKHFLTFLLGFHISWSRTDAALALGSCAIGMLLSSWFRERLPNSDILLVMVLCFWSCYREIIEKQTSHAYHCPASTFSTVG